MRNGTCPSHGSPDARLSPTPRLPHDPLINSIGLNTPRGASAAVIQASDVYIHQGAVPALSQMPGCRAQHRGNEMKTLKSVIFGQMALNTGLLPEDMAEAILAGDTPPTEGIVVALLIAAMDAYAVTINDPQSRWIDRRAARMALAVTFLAAMAVVDDGDAEAERHSGVRTTAEQCRGGK